ncbi:MAG: 16S rRNA (cytosine967-C5)-methyltransferase [Planctomycetota bacterium]|jgi:16S rRNA (cytosine967-C5)-methyltransferase
MARETAWHLLRSGSDTPMRLVDSFAHEAGLEPRDRGLMRKIVGTEVRRRGTLRALVKHFSNGKPSIEMATHLRVGFAQLFFLDQVPVHAAVSETVRATTNTLGQSKGRYVNAVLRTALRARRPGHSGDARCDIVGRDWHLDEPIFHNPEEHPFLWAEDALSVPAPLMKRWGKRLGREAAFELGRIYLEEPDIALRVMAGEREAVIADLAAVDVEARPSSHAASLLVPAGSASAVLGLAAFKEGRLTIQGESAQSAAELMQAREGERILDLCAAPGGKTAVLLQAGANVVAADSNANRLEMLRSGLERFGYADGRLETVVSDGTAELVADTAKFDGVFVDVPCSNTGVLGARPGARWRFGPLGQRNLGELQTRLLSEAAERVAPGGRLVYSTCSIEPDENQYRVREFLANSPEFELEVDHSATPAAPGSSGPVDGGFAARLRRKDGA